MNVDEDIIGESCDVDANVGENMDEERKYEHEGLENKEARMKNKSDLGIQGLMINECVSNTFICSVPKARQDPQGDTNYRRTGSAAGRSTRTGSGRGSPSPWRGIRTTLRTIRRRTSTPGSQGKPSTTPSTSTSTSQSSTAISNVGKLIAMHNGL